MSLQRRSFLKAFASIAPAAAMHNLVAQAPAPPPPAGLHPVGAGQDRSGHIHSLGFSSLAFKVSTADTAGNLFIIEHRNLVPDSGPALHMHLSQEEWFYVMEGRVSLIVGDQRITLGPGESILAPRRIPHTFSSIVPSSHMLIGFSPAGKMEQYFRDANGNGALAASPEFMNRYDMQWIGPSPFHKT